MATYEEHSEPDVRELKRALRRSQLSYQALADEAALELRKIERSERRKHRGSDVPVGVSKALIGQVVQGAATHELRAIAIERALGVDDGEIFVPRSVRGANPANHPAA